MKEEWTGMSIYRERDGEVIEERKVGSEAIQVAEVNL